MSGRYRDHFVVVVKKGDDQQHLLMALFYFVFITGSWLLFDPSLARCLLKFLSPSFFLLHGWSIRWPSVAPQFPPTSIFMSEGLLNIKKKKKNLLVVKTSEREWRRRRRQWGVKERHNVRTTTTSSFVVFLGSWETTTTGISTNWSTTSAYFD